MLTMANFLFVDLNAYASLALWGKGILCLYLVQYTPLGAFCSTEAKKVASLSLQFYSCGFEDICCKVTTFLPHSVISYHLISVF